MRIMMSAAASPVAPSIIRYLQVLGHEVIGHDSQQHFHCDICDRFVRSPPVGEAYLPFLRDFEPQYDLYLPFLDEELRHFCWDTDRFPANCLCSPQTTLFTFTDKASQQQALEKAGLPVAPEIEAIMKPILGRGSRDVVKIGPMPGYVVQRRLKGVEYTIDALTDLDGKFLFAVPRRRLVTNGVSIVGKIEMNNHLIELARDVTKQFKFAGPINIQVIADDDEEDDFIIEVNPRLSGSCIMTVLAGWDILDATVRLWEDKPFIPPRRIEEITIRRFYMEERV